MARAKKLGQAGAAAAAPAATNEDLTRLSEEVAALTSLDLEELRGRWRKVFRAPAPAHLPRYLVLRIIAYRIQANALGELDRETVRFLDAVAEEWQKRHAAGQRNSKRPPLIPPVPDKRSLKPGTILAREHEGELHRVMVLDDGFAWNGATYRSLSEVARAITGTNWNGRASSGYVTRPGRPSPPLRAMEQPVKRETPKPVRCAIYTRVSSDQGLEQDFNSLDNQREAAEAYIKSQAHEGWRCLPAAYDDGGFSGGTLDRPALQRLLADIRARLIDVVVVYKVDRLTRSLADFAKLVELFDQHEVSFVSVTQSFNTTTSMRRLTLNVLLSFAQFEREVTAERIRDKIAASKRKGMRMGGPVALGYDVENKRLVINLQEAERVRLIFQRYLELGCLTKLACYLSERGIHTKLTRRGNGSSRGGIRFTKGPLAHLLKNRVYVGEIVHKGQYYPGEHDPIVDGELFEAVQQKLASRAQARHHARINNGSLLTGRIFDDQGNRMTPSTGKKGSARYRYYVSCALLQGRNEDAGSVPRVPAPDVEAAVLTALKKGTEDLTASGNLPDENFSTGRELIDQFLDKVLVRKNEIEITLREAASNNAAAPIVVPWSSVPATRRREIILPPGSNRNEDRPIRSESRARLVEGIAKARLWLDELIHSRVTDTKEIADREGWSDRSIRMTLSLAFLSPSIVRAAVDGSLPQGYGISTLTGLPAD